MKQQLFFKYGDKVKDLSGIEGTVIASPFAIRGQVRVSFDGKGGDWRDLKATQLTLSNPAPEQSPTPQAQNWKFTGYDENDNVVIEFTIADRIEGEAAKEAESYVENNSLIDDWSLMPQPTAPGGMVQGHTPGEWSAKGTLNTTDENKGWQTTLIAAEPGKPTTCLGFIWGETEAESKANAALIASAPALLQQNQQLTEDIKELTSGLKDIINFDVEFDGLYDYETIVSKIKERATELLNRLNK